MKHSDPEELKIILNLEKEIAEALSFFMKKKDNLKREFRDTKKRTDGSLSGGLYNYKLVEKKINGIRSAGMILEEIKKSRYV